MDLPLSRMAVGDPSPGRGWAHHNEQQGTCSGLSSWASCSALLTGEAARGLPGELSTVCSAIWGPSLWTGLLGKKPQQERAGGFWHPKPFRTLVSLQVWMRGPIPRPLGSVEVLTTFTSK